VGILAGFAVMFCCVVALLLIPVFLFLVTHVYRTSCVLCGLPRPTVLNAFGVMLVSWICLVIAEAIMTELVKVSCDAANVPRWEAAVIVFFLLFPIDLVLSSAIHAALAGIRFGKGIEVWFVQRLIQLGILVAILIVGLIVYLVKALAG
jgi:hypothetical protein